MTPDLDALTALLAAALPEDLEYWADRIRHAPDPGTVRRQLARNILSHAPSLIEAARREAGLREALTELVEAWFLYSDDLGHKDVMVRLAELDAFHAKAAAARALLHDNAGAATPGATEPE